MKQQTRKIFNKKHEGCVKFFLLMSIGLLFCVQGNCAGGYYRASVLDDKVDMLIPDYLKELPEDIAAQKSNALVPKVVFLSKDGTVSITITYRKFEWLALHQENPQEITRLLQNQDYNDIAWANKQVVKLEIKKNNGRNFGIRYIKDQQVTRDITETQYITSLNGYQILFSFSYPAQQADLWKPIGERVFNSIVIHE